MHFAKEFVEGLFEGFFNTAPLPSRSPIASNSILSNHLLSVLMEWERTSQIRYCLSYNRKDLYQKFCEFKDHYSKAPDETGKSVAMFLVQVNEIPDAKRRDDAIRAVTSYILTNPEAARKKLARSMNLVIREEIEALLQNEHLTRR